MHSIFAIPLIGKYGKEIKRELIVVLLTIDWENFTQEMDDIDQCIRFFCTIATLTKTRSKLKQNISTSTMITILIKLHSS